VFDFNRGAIRCYERAGFRIEGLMREKFRMGDAYWNCCVMSQLRSDWDARRTARS
jgi:RimJ/RimL family protein N-acetyltransferase